MDVSDEIILETAWSKLNPGVETRPFDILSAFACTTLGRLMRDDNYYANHPNRTMFALFDWDEAFNEWNMNHSDIIEPDLEKCLVKKRRDRPGYNMLLPVAPTLSCRGQVIDPNTGRHFGSNSSFPIELMFRDVPGLDEHFEVDTTRPGECSRFRGNKVSFANDVVTGLDPAAFEPFRPIFDFIEGAI